MKKTYIAMAILIALALGSWANLWYLERFIVSLRAEITAAQDAPAMEERISLLEQSQARWNAASPYTHIVLRHSDIDNVNNAYYTLLQQLREPDSDPNPSYIYLLDQLWRILEMERVSLGSVM